MRKSVILGAGLLAAPLAVRLVSSRLERAFARHCAEMFDRMPDTCPPKRILTGIEEIREGSARILRLLEDERPDVS